MNVTCPGCSQIVGTYDLCRHREPLCFGCCRDEHRTDYPDPWGKGDEAA